MNIQVGDYLIMKKKHPCGNDIFMVQRVGMDFKIECTQCKHLVMANRGKIQKNIKQIIKKDNIT